MLITWLQCNYYNIADETSQQYIITKFITEHFYYFAIASCWNISLWYCSNVLHASYKMWSPKNLTDNMLLKHYIIDIVGMFQTTVIENFNTIIAAI